MERDPNKSKIYLCTVLPIKKTYLLDRSKLMAKEVKEWYGTQQQIRKSTDMWSVRVRMVSIAIARPQDLV